MNSPRLWYAGTPAFAAHSLQALIDAGYSIDGVLTQPDRPAGRGRKLTASAVKQTAAAHHIPVAQPEKLHADAPPFPELPRPDLIIVAAYGLLLPPWFLAYPRLGCINIHASLLPRWRGAAPIQRAIEAGDRETGVGIMQMDEGLDTGAVWQESRLTIAPDDTAATLHDRLMQLGADTLLRALPDILAQTRVPTPQATEGITYAHKLSKAEARKLESQLVETGRQYRAASAELTEEYNLRRNEEFAALQRKANEIIFNIIETEHYDAMLSEVIFIRGEFDITDRVIKLLDAEMQ